MRSYGKAFARMVSSAELQKPGEVNVCSWPIVLTHVTSERDAEEYARSFGVAVYYLYEFQNEEITTHSSCEILHRSPSVGAAPCGCPCSLLPRRHGRDLHFVPEGLLVADGDFAVGDR